MSRCAGGEDVPCIVAGDVGDSGGKLLGGQLPGSQLRGRLPSQRRLPRDLLRTDQLPTPRGTRGHGGEILYFFPLSFLYVYEFISTNKWGHPSQDDLGLS